MKKTLMLTLLFSMLYIIFALPVQAEIPCIAGMTLFEGQDVNLPVWTDAYVPCSDSVKWELKFDVIEGELWGAISAGIFGADTWIDVLSFEYTPDSTYVLTGYAESSSIRNALIIDIIVGPPSGHFKNISFTVWYFNSRNELAKTTK